MDTCTHLPSYFVYSYGGMLTAYFRFKYPNLVDAALAASAPIYLIAGESSPFGFYEIVTKVILHTHFVILYLVFEDGVC